VFAHEGIQFMGGTSNHFACNGMGGNSNLWIFPQYEGKRQGLGILFSFFAQYFGGEIF